MVGSYPSCNWNPQRSPMVVRCDVLLRSCHAWVLRRWPSWRGIGVTWAHLIATKKPAERRRIPPNGWRNHLGNSGVEIANFCPDGWMKVNEGC